MAEYTVICTDGGRHPVTVLRSAGSDDDPIVGEFWRPGPCPRCGRDPRLGWRTRGLIGAWAKQQAPDRRRPARLDISTLPI